MTSTPNITSPCARLKRPLSQTEADRSIHTPERKRRMKYKVNKVLRSIDGVCGKYKESLKSVLRLILFRLPTTADSGKEVEDVISDIIERLVSEEGEKKAMEELMGDEILSKYIESLRVPDWVLLYFKLEAKLPAR